ncbi:MAG: magnesium transporter [Planctomycetota bacterium]
MSEDPPPAETPPAAEVPLPAAPSPSEIRRAVRAARLSEVQSALERLSPMARAEAFLQLGSRERGQVLKAAPPALAASLLADCDSATLADLLSTFRLRDLAPALRLIAPDDLADLVPRLPAAKSEEVLEQLEAGPREEVRRLMTFDPESAGGMMTPRYLSVPDMMTAGKALEMVRESAPGVSSSYIYLVDAGGRLAGVVPLRGLVLAAPRDPVRDFGLRDVERLRTSAPASEVLASFERRPLLSIPVVDDKDRLVGIVTADDAVAVRQRAEEKVIRGVTGVDPREALRATLSAAAGRAPWLGATVAAGLGCAMVASAFHHVVTHLAVIGAFVPLVLALADSVASQTMAVVLSARSGSSAHGAALRALLWKELRVGILVSVTGAVAVALCSVAWHRRFDLALLIGGSVVVAGAWAAFLGAVMPGVLERASIKPEAAGGPLTLAVADLSALIIFLGSAAAFLSVRGA